MEVSVTSVAARIPSMSATALMPDDETAKTTMLVLRKKEQKSFRHNAANSALIIRETAVSRAAHNSAEATACDDLSIVGSPDGVVLLELDQHLQHSLEYPVD